jgi:hypothetical protein
MAAEYWDKHSIDRLHMHIAVPLPFEFTLVS